MWWLWIVGPIAVAVIYALTAEVDKRRAAEGDAWAAGAGLKKVAAAPSELGRMFEEAGGGMPLRIYELVPKLAYLGLFDADASSASQHQTVVCKLDAPAPYLSARPLPIVEGNRIANVGVPFPKHPSFAELYLVEGPDHAAIKKWLVRPLRNALLDLPETWVRVDGKAMAVTLYGGADADRIDDLVATADVLFAEYGADGGPSLLPDLDDDGDEDDEPPPPPKVAAKVKPAAKGAAPAAAAKAQPAAKGAAVAAAAKSGASKPAPKAKKA